MAQAWQQAVLSWVPHCCIPALATQTALGHGNTTAEPAPVIHQVIIPCQEQQPAEVLSAVGGDWAKQAEQTRIWNWGEIGTGWSNFPPKLYSTEDMKGGFPKTRKERLVLPSLVAAGKHSSDWINKTTTFIMPWLKALQGRQWLTGLLLLTLFSLSRGRMCAEVGHIWISSKWERYPSFTF